MQIHFLNVTPNNQLHFETLHTLPTLTQVLNSKVLI